MTTDPSNPRPDGVAVPFVFVPDGTPVPDGFSGPDWVRIPATFAPSGSGRRTESGAPWPCDASGREWPADRFGRPDCPPWAMAPGVRRPGEGAREGDPAWPEYTRYDPTFGDPAATMRWFLNPLQIAAAGGRSGTAAEAPAGPVTPASPDWSALVPSQPGKAPVYDIYVGGWGDESRGGPVLRYANDHANQDGHNTVYFPWTIDLAALAKYIDSLPPDARINVIGHSYGGDTAANAAILTGRRIDLLVTIDPVSHIARPDYATVEAHVGMWIDVNAATTDKGGLDNYAAGIGGPWNRGPQGIADRFIDAAANHKQFSAMMRTPGPDGLTAAQALS